ncbi:MAG: GGDEF domain-containing protein [Cellulosilyticaceae bacterium]
MKYEEIVGNIDRLKNDDEYISGIYTFTSSLSPKDAKTFIERVILLAKDNACHKAEAGLIRHLGWAYLDMLSFDKAIYYHQLAYGMFGDINDARGLITTASALQEDYAAQELWDMAIEWGLKGIELAEDNQDEELLSMILINVAAIYNGLGEYNKSHEILERLKKIAYSLTSLNKVCKYVIQSECEIGQGNLTRALNYAQKAYELAKKEKVIVITEALQALGIAYTQLEAYEKAEVYFKEGLQLSEEYNQHNIMANTLIEWSKLHLEQKQYKEALEKAFKGIKRIDQINSRRELKEAYLCINTAFQALGDYQNAVKYLEMYMALQKESERNKSHAWVLKLDNKRAEIQATTYKLLYDQMEILSDIGQQITSNLDRSNILDIIETEIHRLIQIDVFHVALCTQESLEYILSIEDKVPIDVKNVSVNEDSLGNYCVKSKKDILINDITKDYHKYFDDYTAYIEKVRSIQNRASEKVPQSALFTLVQIEGEVVGVMSVQSYRKDTYTNKDLNTLKILGSYLAIGLKNSDLFEKTNYWATHDSLTEILNRKELVNKGGKLYTEISDLDAPMCCAMIDIDHFKQVNDRYGHIVGDKVLKKVAQVISNSLRKTDMIGRYGGEEFLMFLPYTDKVEAISIAEKIRKSIENMSVEVDEQESVNVTLSLGVVEVCKEKSFAEFINQADTALYVAKETGRNKVVDYNLKM